MNSAAPKISVITAVFNNDKHIAGCIDSVLGQTYSDVEYIIIDGGSTDDTLSIIDRYRDRIDCIVSEPDKGISDAMNKGISASTGDYLIFLHSDDYFASENSLAEAVSHLSENCQLLLCDILFGEQLSHKKSRGFTPLMNVKNGIWHQGSICARSMFNTHGLFDDSLKIAMDYDFFLRLYRGGVKARKCDVILSVMRDTGISSQQDKASLANRFCEERMIHFKHSNQVIARFGYQIYWLLYPLYKRVNIGQG